MDVSPYEGVVEVPVGDGGVVVMRERIPGAARAEADRVRVRVRSSAKASTGEGQKVAVGDMSVETEMDEAAYDLALLMAFVVSWNLTRRGMPIPLDPPAVKAESIRGLPDNLYSALAAKARELVEAASRTQEQQVQFRDGAGHGHPYGINV